MNGWSLESWKAFWAAPSVEIAATRVPRITAEDVEAVWPRSQHPVRGPRAYAGRVIDLLSLVPDLRLELQEYAGSGEIHFLRWQAHGSSQDGRFKGIGCDRIMLRDGLVVSNLVMSDMPVFDLLEALQARNGS